MMGMSRGLAFLSGSILCISLVAFADAQQESAGQTGEASKQVSQGLSKRDYVRTRMQWSRNNPNWNPTVEELEARFDAADTDGDGFLSEEEQEAERAARRRPAAAERKPEAQEGKGVSKRDYVRTRMQWAKNNPNWNPTTEELEKRFDELDKDGDGFLSEEEQAAEKARGLSKREYVRTRLDWSRSNPNWNPTVEELEARFDAADKDGDGFLSEEEQAAERANRRR